MFCHKCGTALEDGVKFCPNCGTAVISAEPARTPPQQIPNPPAPTPAPKIPNPPAQTPLRQPVAPQPTVQAPQRPAYPPAAQNPAAPGFRPVYQTAPAYAAKKEKRGWPVPAWLFCIFALLTAAVGSYYLLMDNMIYMRETFLSIMLGGIRQYRLAIYLEGAATVFPYFFAMLLFLCHTKKSPWITALPWTVLLIGFSVSKFYMITRGRTLMRYEYGEEIYLYVASLLIITLLWWLVVTIRPNGAALKVIFLVFALLLSIGWFLLKLLELFSIPLSAHSYHMFGSALVAFANLLMVIGYSVAGFAVRKKQKA